MCLDWFQTDSKSAPQSLISIEASDRNFNRASEQAHSTLTIWTQITVVDQKVPGPLCSTSPIRIDSRYFLCFRRFRPPLEINLLIPAVVTQVNCSSRLRPIHEL